MPPRLTAIAVPCQDNVQRKQGIVKMLHTMNGLIFLDYPTISYYGPNVFFSCALPCDDDSGYTLLKVSQKNHWNTVSIAK